MNGLAGIEPWLARCSFPSSGEFVCGVSGGADSLAMLALSVAAGLDVEAVHVDHGQRAESETDIVASMAHRWGARFRSERVEVAAGPNLEARMRAARYQVLGPGAATGHTADDQAETVLINLLRGAGLPGLGAMCPGVRRPILQLRRSDTESICGVLGVEPFHDPTNMDPKFLRNRVRRELIPLINDLSDRDTVPLLVRTAGLARDASESLDRIAASIDVSDAVALASTDRYLAGAAVRLWLREKTASPHPVDTASINRVLEVAAGAREATEVSGGHRVSRSQQRLRVHAVRPPNLQLARTTSTWTAESVPRGLLNDHRTSVWAELVVVTGRVVFVDAETDTRISVRAGDRHVIVPQVRHFIEPEADAQFFVQFFTG